MLTFHEIRLARDEHGKRDIVGMTIFRYHTEGEQSVGRVKFSIGSRSREVRGTIKHSLKTDGKEYATIRVHGLPPVKNTTNSRDYFIVIKNIDLLLENIYDFQQALTVSVDGRNEVPDIFEIDKLTSFLGTTGRVVKEVKDAKEEIRSAKEEVRSAKEEVRSAKEKVEAFNIPLWILAVFAVMTFFLKLTQWKYSDWPF